MEKCLKFYLKVEGELVEIKEFQNTSILMETCKDQKVGELKALSGIQIKEWKYAIKDAQAVHEKTIQDYETEIEDIKRLNYNSVEEKYSKICEIRQLIRNEEERRNNCLMAFGFLFTLRAIIEALYGMTDRIDPLELVFYKIEEQVEI